MPNLASRWDRLSDGFDSPWRLRRALARAFCSPVARAVLVAGGVRVGTGAQFFGIPIVRRYAGSRIEIGAHVDFRSWPASNVLGLAHPVMLTTMAPNALISIGDGVGLSGTTIAAAERVVIGKGAVIGADVIITDNDHHVVGAGLSQPGIAPVRHGPVEIGEEVFVGARALILKGVQIGPRAVVGAGAVVTRSVPAGTIVAGNPARVVGWVMGDEHGTGEQP